jgi:hypothetical protein
MPKASVVLAIAFEEIQTGGSRVPFHHGGSPFHHPFYQDFHYNKPSSYWDTTIYGMFP